MSSPERPAPRRPDGDGRESGFKKHKSEASHGRAAEGDATANGFGKLPPTEPAAGVDTAQATGLQGKLEVEELATIKKLDMLRLQGSGHAEIGPVQRRLGCLRLLQGKPQPAIADLQEALEMSRKAHGDIPHPDVVAALHATGVFYLQQRDFKAAKQSVHEALDVQQKLHGADVATHLMTSVLQDLLAKVEAAAASWKAWVEEKIRDWPKEAKQIKEFFVDMSERRGAWLVSPAFSKLVKGIEQVAFPEPTRGFGTRGGNAAQLQDIQDMLVEAEGAPDANMEGVLAHFVDEYSVDLPEEHHQNAAEHMEVEPRQDPLALLLAADSYFSAFRPQEQEVEVHPVPEDPAVLDNTSIEQAVTVQAAESTPSPPNPLERFGAR